MDALKQKGVLLLVAFSFCAAPLGAQEGRSTYMEVRRTTRSASPSTQVAEEVEQGRPKYRKRIKDLGDQIHLVRDKGFITQEEADKFLNRQTELFAMEADVRKNGFPRPASNDLEKSITLLNEQVFKASHKNDPIKPGQAEKEVNDPNLIPAYPDKDLQPGSGKVSAPKSN